MGRGSAPRLHRCASAALHHATDRSRPLGASPRCERTLRHLRKSRGQLSRLVGERVLSPGHDRAGRAPLARDLELWALARCRETVDASAAPARGADPRDRRLAGLLAAPDRRHRRSHSLMEVRSRVPAGPIERKWDRHRFEIKLVSPANKRRYSIIVVGTGLAGGAAAASLSELGYNVKAF